MLISGLPLFALASLCAAFSPNVESLIAARVFLALGAAMMMPATLSIVRHIFTYTSFAPIKKRSIFKFNSA